MSRRSFNMGTGAASETKRSLREGDERPQREELAETTEAAPGPLHAPPATVTPMPSPKPNPNLHPNQTRAGRRKGAVPFSVSPWKLEGEGEGEAKGKGEKSLALAAAKKVELLAGECGNSLPERVWGRFEFPGLMDERREARFAEPPGKVPIAMVLAA